MRVLLLLLLDLLLLLLVDVLVGESVCRRAHRSGDGRRCERVRDRTGEVGVRERVGGCDAFRGVELEKPVEEVDSWCGAYIFREQVITFNGGLKLTMLVLLSLQLRDTLREGYLWIARILFRRLRGVRLLKQARHDVRIEGTKIAGRGTYTLGGNPAQNALIGRSDDTHDVQ